MSIIIKNMKMPDNCYECSGCEFNYSGDYSQAEAYCCLHKDMLTIVSSWQDHEMLDTIKKEKPDWCPLVEISKGARLIDAEALYSDIIHRFDYCDDFLEMLEEAPAIFEEDKE